MPERVLEKAHDLGRREKADEDVKTSPFPPSALPLPCDITVDPPVFENRSMFALNPGLVTRDAACPDPSSVLRDCSARLAGVCRNGRADGTVPMHY